jgi:transposase
MGYSSDLTDKEWEIIEPLLPQKKKSKKTRMDNPHIDTNLCSTSLRSALSSGLCPLDRKISRFGGIWLNFAAYQYEPIARKTIDPASIGL